MSKEQRNRVRHSLVVNFYTPAAKAAFSNRLELVRSFLTPDGQPELDNNGLMVAMFDLVERCTPFSPGTTRAFSIRSFNKDNGKSIVYN